MALADAELTDDEYRCTFAEKLACCKIVHERESRMPERRNCLRCGASARSLAIGSVDILRQRSAVVFATARTVGRTCAELTAWFHMPVGDRRPCYFARLTARSSRAAATPTACARLWIWSGVHHPAARHGRARDPYPKGAMRAWSPLRDAVACRSPVCAMLLLSYCLRRQFVRTVL